MPEKGPLSGGLVASSEEQAMTVKMEIVISALRMFHRPLFIQILIACEDTDRGLWTAVKKRFAYSVA